MTHICECGHAEKYHPQDIVYGDDGYEDDASPCRVPGCRCRDYEDSGREENK